MAVTIRFRRFGKKMAPTFRLVAADQRRSRDGRVIEFLGHYNPKNEKDVSIKKDRVDYWVKQGAVLSQSVGQLLKRLGRSH